MNHSSDREELAALLSAYCGITPPLPDSIFMMNPDHALEKWTATTNTGAVEISLPYATGADLVKGLIARAREHGQDFRTHVKQFAIRPPKDVLTDPENTELRRMRRETMDREEIHRKLDLAGMRYELAKEAVERARDEWHAEIRAAVSAGMMKSEIARVTGLARPYIHSVIKEGEQ